MTEKYFHLTTVAEKRIFQEMFRTEERAEYWQQFTRQEDRDDMHEYVCDGIEALFNQEYDNSGAPECLTYGDLDHEIVVWLHSFDLTDEGEWAFSDAFVAEAKRSAPYYDEKADFEASYPWACPWYTQFLTDFIKPGDTIEKAAERAANDSAFLDCVADWERHGV